MKVPVLAYTIGKSKHFSISFYVFFCSICIIFALNNNAADTFITT